MTMRAATALPEAPLEGQKLALRPSSFPRALASGLRASQPANTNRENPCAYDERASESCTWTTKDPIRFRGHQLNLYAYAGCDPVNRRDRRGTDSPECYACIGFNMFERQMCFRPGRSWDPREFRSVRASLAAPIATAAMFADHLQLRLSPRLHRHPRADLRPDVTPRPCLVQKIRRRTIRKQWNPSRHAPREAAEQSFCLRAGVSSAEAGHDVRYDAHLCRILSCFPGSLPSGGKKRW